MIPSSTICVITATVGRDYLHRCLQSVQAQTLAGVSHCVVIDGPEHAERTQRIINGVQSNGKPIHVLQLPEPTGKDGWICHRIYGATPFLVNADWICYLDEDNWFDPDHLASLLAAVTRKNALWGFALRKICDEAGNVACLDQCESLGSLHDVFTHPGVRLVDTNCYLLRRDLAIHFSPIWNRPREPKGKHRPDFELCMELLRQKIEPAPTLRHTVNYTVFKQHNAVPIEYFKCGNETLRERYPQGLPWEIAPGRIHPY